MTTTDDPLVSTDWLAAHMEDPKVRIVDASFKLPGVMPLPVDDYLAAHIPGAVFFDVDAVSDHSVPLPHMYPDAAQFARDVAALGISSGDTVVAYDSGGWVAAPRAWWMFLSFGHGNVKVLDGGLKKWEAEGRPTHSGKATPKPGKFQAKLDPDFIRSKQQLVGNLDSHAEQLIDARPRARFEGTVAEPRRGLRGGHIPGSRNLRGRLHPDGHGRTAERGDSGFCNSGALIDRCGYLIGHGHSALIGRGRRHLGNRGDFRFG